MSIVKMTREELIRLLWDKRKEGVRLDFIEDYGFRKGEKPDQGEWSNRNFNKFHAEIFCFDGIMTLLIAHGTDRIRDSFIYRFTSYLTEADEAKITDEKRFKWFSETIVKFFNHHLIHENQNIFVKGEKET